MVSGFFIISACFFDMSSSPSYFQHSNNIISAKTAVALTAIHCIINRCIVSFCFVSRCAVGGRLVSHHDEINFSCSSGENGSVGLFPISFARIVVRVVVFFGSVNGYSACGSSC